MTPGETPDRAAPEAASPGAAPAWVGPIVQGLAGVRRSVEDLGARVAALEADRAATSALLARVEHHLDAGASGLTELLASRDAAGTLGGQIVARAGELVQLAVEATRDVLRSPAGVVLAVAVLVGVAGSLGVGVAYGPIIVGAIAAESPSAPAEPDAANRGPADAPALNAGADTEAPDPDGP